MEGRPSQKLTTRYLGNDIPSINTNPDSLDGPSSSEHASVACHTTTAWASRIRPCLPADVISLIAALIPGLFIPWSSSTSYTTFVEYAKTALAFSQISRLFREVALHTPTLWSRIYVTDFRRHIFLWELFLARSRMAPLYVIWDIEKDLDFDYGIADFALFFNSQRRWKELSICGGHRFFKVFSSFNRSELMPTLPALEVLSVTVSRATQDVPFLTPNLKHLCTRYPLIFGILAPTLASCRIVVPLTIGYDYQVFFDRFKEFLGLCTLLESLWIAPANLANELDHKYINLPSMKTLRVDSHGMITRSLRIFLQSMHMANLETLEIRYVKGEDASFADLFDSLGFASQVRSLTLTASFQIKYTSVPFRAIDERFCSVSSMTFSGWTCTDQIRGCQFPTLRRLVVEWPSSAMIRRPIPKDVKITVEDVLEFLQNRLNSDGQEEYEPFHLILCGYGPAAEEEDVERIVSQAGDKLVFEAHPSAEPFYSFVSPYIDVGRSLD